MSVLRSLARWLLKDPGDADRAVAIDDGGTAQDAGHWMGPPVKDEPAASVHTLYSLTVSSELLRGLSSVLLV